ncbi:hypothetical protein PFISCL1PPCAC_22968, partial [Pristionchus fissidentatus]
TKMVKKEENIDSPDISTVCEDMAALPSIVNLMQLLSTESMAMRKYDDHSKKKQIIDADMVPLRKEKRDLQEIIDTTTGLEQKKAKEEQASTIRKLSLFGSKKSDEKALAKAALLEAREASASIASLYPGDLRLRLEYYGQE